MAWFVLHLFRERRAGPPVPPAPDQSVLPADFDALFAGLRDLQVAVPCSGCGGAHEMSCAELVARQLIRGAGWSSEECDDTAAFASILSPEEVAACGGDVAAIRARLERRGVLRSSGAAEPSPEPVLAGRRETHHILPSY